MKVLIDGKTLIQSFPLAVDNIIAYIKAVDVANFSEICYLVFSGMGREELILKLIHEMVKQGWLSEDSGRFRVTQAGEDRF